MIIILVFLFLVFPMMSAPFLFTAYIRDAKFRVLYSLLIGLVFGIIAYHLVPPANFDLFRHHIILTDMYTLKTENLAGEVTSNEEPAKFLINFFVSRFRNVNILQFGIVSIGYWILLYMLRDYAKIKNIKTSSFLIVLSFTLASFTCINFFSGLWNYLAMLIFALAFYLEYIKNRNKVLTYSMYAVTPLIHSSMLFPCLLILIFKLCGERINFRLIGMTAAFFGFQQIIHALATYFSNVASFSQLESMYQSYFVNGSQFTNLYGGKVLYMEIAKLAVYILVLLQIRKNKEIAMKKVTSFLTVLVFSTLLLIPASIVSLRFVLLIQFIGSIVLMTYLSGKRSTTVLLTEAALILMTLIFLFYQYTLLKPLSFGRLLPEGFISSLPWIF